MALSCIKEEFESFIFGWLTLMFSIVLIVCTAAISNTIIKSQGYEIISDASYMTKSGIIEPFDETIYKKDGIYYTEESKWYSLSYPFKPEFKEIKTPNLVDISIYRNNNSNT